MLKKAIYLFLILIVFSSCGEFDKMLRSDNSDKKLKIADQYFAKGNYIKASLLYESMLEGFKYNPDVERIYFQLAECNYYLYDFYNAGYHYKTYFEYFPQGKYSEVARFRHAICGYRESLAYNLDPTYTKKSIENLQLFINYFPESYYVDSCNKFIDLSRKKLELKAYENAYLYFNIENYKAAITAFKNFSRDFPETDKHPNAAFYIVKSAYLLASNSIDSKKIKRLVDVSTEFMQLEQELKNTEFYLPALEIKNNSEKQIENIAFEYAYSFYNNENYQEALIAFKNFAIDYPDAEKHANSLLYILKSSYMKAKISNENSRRSLMDDVFAQFSELQNELINTAYYKDALEIKKDAERQIEKLNKN